ncbi:MAG: recombination mediator RecR [Chitinophagales bacterium]|nr:recombination mediator RecR [Chitinophagales bacterium]
MEFPSKLIENAVNEFAKLPGIGQKTALRLVLHLLKQSNDNVNHFGEAIVRMRNEISYCKQCHNVADSDLCTICSNPMRDAATICVVENLRDVIAIENTHQFKGTYHVLGDIISPVDGIGPEDIEIDSLVERVSQGVVKEVIMALAPTIEGDTTIFYLTRKLQPFAVKITTIARGIAFGGELEYADEMTLARSLVNRLPYEKYMTNQ